MPEQSHQRWRLKLFPSLLPGMNGKTRSSRGVLLLRKNFRTEDCRVARLNSKKNKTMP